MNAHYEAVIEALRAKGIRAEFHRPDQLVLPSRIWITWADGWYVSTWTPACYPVPADVDIVELCQECLEYDDGPFYAIPDDVAQRYRLHRMSNSEFETLFSTDSHEVDDG